MTFQEWLTNPYKSAVGSIEVSKDDIKSTTLGKNGETFIDLDYGTVKDMELVVLFIPEDSVDNILHSKGAAGEGKTAFRFVPSPKEKSINIYSMANNKPEDRQKILFSVGGCTLVRTGVFLEKYCNVHVDQENVVIDEAGGHYGGNLKILWTPADIFNQ